MTSLTSPPDIRPDHLEIVQNILREHLPAGFQVWVFGSRANWATKDSSDLDLAVEGADALDYKAMVGLEVALEESDLPYTVDVVDLNAVSQEFKKIVEDQRIPLSPAAAPRKASSEWRKVTLGELTENFDAIRVPVKESDRKPGPYPYYGASGVVDRVDGFLFDGQYLLIAEDGENLRTRATPIAFLADGRFWVNNHAHIVRGNHHADTRFLNYALSNLDISGYLTGSTMPKLTQRNMNQILLTVPPLPEQRRIAHILGTLDDKIDLNRRMNQTLEEIARAVFQDWFVDFGPVRAKLEGREPYLPPELWDLFPDRLVESELGEVPEGWGVGVLDDAVELLSGGTPKTSVPEYWDGGIPWYTAKDAPSLSDIFVLNTERSLTQAGIDNSSTKILPFGTTVITARGTVGHLACLGIPMAMNQTCYGIRGAKGYPDFFTYWNTRNTVSQLRARTHGTIFDTINRETFKIAETVLPPTEVAGAFEFVVKPTMERILGNLKESRALVAHRDALLPKLVSGEVGIGETL